MEPENLLREFPPVATVDWEAAITKDLKGADYEKHLLWQTQDGFSVRPYYRAEDLRGLACLDAAPGEFPFRRGTRATGQWGIREEIEEADLETANVAAAKAIAAGADAIAFGRLPVENIEELDRLLKNLNGTCVHFAQADSRLLRLLAEHAPKAAFKGISTGCDATSDITLAMSIAPELPDRLVPFTIHGEEFAESGATAAEEIGFSLAAGVDFLAVLDESGIPASRAAHMLEFGFATGGNYFLEIAKFRAFRMVWARAAERFGATEAASRARIAARTSKWNKTIYDNHVNIMRGTTEAMAAIIGGADWVTVEPFDSCNRAHHETSQRLARNTQLLLRHEAGLGRVKDPGGGSYYLENITDHLAREAWKILQQIEKSNGYRNAVADGEIARVLAQRQETRRSSVATRRLVLVGTNQFSNAAERKLDQIDDGLTVDPRRGARAFEQLLLAAEWHEASGGKMPRILLAEIGDAKMRGARSNFAANFFACAGFETSTRRFKRADEIAATEGDLIVLCSSDAEYADLASQLRNALRASGRTTPVVIAGNPQNAAELRAIGIADFIHLRSDVAEGLKKWQVRFGIVN